MGYIPPAPACPRIEKRRFHVAMAVSPQHHHAAGKLPSTRHDVSNGDLPAAGPLGRSGKNCDKVPAARDLFIFFLALLACSGPRPGAGTSSWRARAAFSSLSHRQSIWHRCVAARPLSHVCRAGSRPRHSRAEDAISDHEPVSDTHIGFFLTLTFGRPSCFRTFAISTQCFSR